MAWCHQATSHYLNQCWPRSILPYGITRPQVILACCCHLASWVMVIIASSSGLLFICHHQSAWTWEDFSTKENKILLKFKYFHPWKASWNTITFWSFCPGSNELKPVFFLHTGQQLAGDLPLGELGVGPNGTVQLEIQSADPINQPIRPFKPRQEYHMPDVITVRVPSGMVYHFDGLRQDCDNSIALAMELPQSSSKYWFVFTDRYSDMSAMSLGRVGWISSLPW